MSDNMPARDLLRSIIERIERLEEEKKTIADDIKDVKTEAKSQGLSVAVINEIIKLRKMDPNERAEKEALLDMYRSALGMLPLEEYAVREIAPAYAEAKGSGSVTPVSPGQEDGIANSPDRREADARRSPIHESPSNRDVSADGEAWAPGAPQGYPDQPQAKAEVEASEDEPSELAGHEGRSEGEAASVGLPTNPNPQASSSRQADKAETAPPPVVSATFNNPKCLNPKTCLSVHSKAACFDCVMEYSKRPPEEQKRLWAEAVQQEAIDWAARNEVAA